MILHWWIRIGSDWWFSKILVDQDCIGFNFIGSGLDSDWKISQSADRWPVRPMQCCQPYVFPRIWACFLQSSKFFWRLAGMRVACFYWNLLVFWACFFRYLFCGLLFFKFYGTFCFKLLVKAIWAFLCENTLILGLFFRMCLPGFYLVFLPIFYFVEFSCQTHVGLVFRLNYLFWACFSNLLAYFCKITWHHWAYVYASPVCFFGLVFILLMFIVIPIHSR